MISLNAIFGMVERVYMLVYETTFNYFSAMSDIFVNTWHSENNPLRTHIFPWICDFGVSFDGFLGKFSLDSQRQFLKDNGKPLLAAFACALGLFTTLKIMWYCAQCVFGKRCSEQAPNPSAITEARRWYKQAESDHEASQNDLSGENPAYEWVCYKCQQATEKCLKAANMISNHNVAVTQCHDLQALVMPLDDGRLSADVLKLQDITGVTSRMRYPDVLPPPHVPHDIFSQTQATDAWDTTRQILKYVKRKYLT